MTLPAKARELRSLITDGKLELSLQDVDVPTPGPGEVVVRIEAAPINPSDQPLLLGPADLSTLASDGGVTTAAIPEAMAGMVAARLGKSLPAGNEGAGVVVAAGDGAEHLIGKTVAVLGGGMYTQYRKVPRRVGAGLCRRRHPGAGRVRVRQSADRARHGRDDEDGGAYRAGPHRRRVQPRPDAQQGLHRRRRRPGEHRPQRRTGEDPDRYRREICGRFVEARFPQRA